MIIFIQTIIVWKDLCKVILKLWRTKLGMTWGWISERIVIFGWPNPFSIVLWGQHFVRMSVKRGHEITLVWQVFVMLCVKSFDYKATMTALINDLFVFVLSVCFCECVCVNCPEASATSFTLWSLPIVTPTVGQTTAEYTLTKLTFVLWGHAHSSSKFSSIH